MSQHDDEPTSPDAFSKLTLEGVVNHEHFRQFVAQATVRGTDRNASTAPGIGFLVVTFLATFGFLQWAGRVARPIDRTAWIGPGEVAALALLTGMLLSLGLMWLISRNANAGYSLRMLRDGGSYIGPRQFVLDDSGITVSGAHGFSTTRWSVISDMTDSPDAYLLWTDPGAALMIPKAALSDVAAHATFKKAVAHYLDKNRYNIL